MSLLDEAFKRVRRAAGTDVATETRAPDVPAPTVSEAARTVESFNFIPTCEVIEGSQLAEEFRLLRTNILALAKREGMRSLVFSSCHHGEGKTTCAVNAARFLARKQGIRVLLVDGDLRRPNVARFLGLMETDERTGRQTYPGYGFDDVLMGAATLEEGLVHSVGDNLTVLPSRKGHGDAADILEVPHTAHVLSRLEREFDIVLYDSSPVLSTVDPRILGAGTSGIILVVHAGKTQRENINYVRETLAQADVPLVGVVLTHVKLYLPRYLYRYHYCQDYYYRHHREYLEEEADQT